MPIKEGSGRKYDLDIKPQISLTLRTFFSKARRGAKVYTSWHVPCRVSSPLEWLQAGRVFREHYDHFADSRSRKSIHGRIFPRHQGATRRKLAERTLAQRLPVRLSRPLSKDALRTSLLPDRAKILSNFLERWSKASRSVGLARKRSHITSARTCREHGWNDWFCTRKDWRRQGTGGSICTGCESLCLLLR